MSNAKKNEVGAEPVEQTDADIAKANAAAEKSRVAALEAQAEADAEAEKQRDKVAKQLAALEAKNQKLSEQLAETQAQQAELAQLLSQPGRIPATLKLRSTALNAERALEHIADIWPDDGTQEAPLAVVAKTYRVTPIGKNSANMPIAEVSNCSDEADAKAAYYQRVQGHPFVEIVLIDKQEYKRATADPASAVA